MNVGNNIKKYRKRKRITQPGLASIINKSESSIQKYESGKVVPDIATIENLALALGVTLNDLIGYDEIAKQQITKEAASSATKLWPFTGDENSWIMKNLDPKQKEEYIRKSKEYLERVGSEPNVYDPSRYSNEDIAMEHLKALVWYVSGLENLSSENYDIIFDNVCNTIKFEFFKIKDKSDDK